MIRRDDRRRLLQARIAIERADLMLALSELREAAAPARIACSMGATVWAALVKQRPAGTAPGGAVLLGALQRHPLLATTATALLPWVRRFVMRRLSVKRIAIGAALAGAGWAAWRVTHK